MNLLCSTALLLVLLASACAGLNSGPIPATARSPAPAVAAPPSPSAASNEIVGKLWRWQRTQSADGTPLTPDAPERYTVSFQAGGRAEVRADCNRGSSTYEVKGSAITMAAPTLTKMGCPPNSYEAEFVRDLARVSGYLLRQGELVLLLPNGGAMRFRPQP